MDEIAQSESYKRTSLCYLEEGRRLLQRKWELGGTVETEEVVVVVAMARMEARRRIDEAKRDTAVVLAKKRANHSTVLPTGLDHSNRPRTCKNSQPERKGKKGGRKRENGTDATRTRKTA